MLRDLICGADRSANKRLDDFWDSIGEEENILWYPSAGNDYRDILELNTVRAEEHGIVEKPNIFIHTDYHFKEAEMLDGKDRNYYNTYGQHFFCQRRNDEIPRTTVRVESSYELMINPEFVVNYHVNRQFVGFADLSSQRPRLYLLDVTVISDIYGELHQPLFYFAFENINFLEEVLLRHRLNVTHIVKVREGCGFGGNRKSIALSYAFFTALKTKYLVVDHEEHFDYNLFESLKQRCGHRLQKYRLIPKCTIEESWSGFSVSVFEVEHGNEPLTHEDIAENLEILKRERVKIIVF